MTNGTNVGWFDNVRLTAEADGGGDPAGRQLSSLQTDLPASGLAGVRQAQANVAASDPNSHLIVTDSLDLRSDNLHFSSAGQVSLGQALATAYQAEAEP